MSRLCRVSDLVPHLNPRLRNPFKNPPFVLSQVPGDQVRETSQGAADSANNRLQRERSYVSYGGGAQEPDDVRVPAGRYPGNFFICVPLCLPRRHPVYK